MSDKTETYCVEVICNNCAAPQHDSEENPGIVIPKGTAVGAFLRDRKCTNCGLIGTLRRKFYPEPLLQYTDNNRGNTFVML